ncbi:MAG: DEAD/DEAH box helicase [Cellvibrionaceae bacterium]
MTLFTELPLQGNLLKAIHKLGFENATDVQAKTIPKALAGEDLMISANTGTGKTAAFILPILQKLLETDSPNTGTRALILLPTRELALQIQKVFKQLAAFTHIKSSLIIGGEAFKYQIAAIRKNPEVLIATPGRLVEHINKGTPDFKDLEILVLDEADRMLDMGFAIDMNAIANACNPNRQNLLFSATLQHTGMTRIDGILRKPTRIEIDNQQTGHELIKQEIILSDDTKHKEKLLIALCEEDTAKKIIVFSNTRAQSQQLSNLLRSKKLRTGYIHGELSQSNRKQVLNQYRDNKLQILVATDVAARGLDIPDVDLVINFNVAHSGDEHVHRVGRTGRAGQSGKALTLVEASEWNLMSSIERYLKIRFERTGVQGLKANYKGPKKLKKSGKAAGKKHKKKDKIKTQFSSNRKTVSKSSKIDPDKSLMKKNTKKPINEN